MMLRSLLAGGCCMAALVATPSLASAQTDGAPATTQADTAIGDPVASARLAADTDRDTSAASPGVPGSTTSRASTSASTTSAPRAASSSATALLPDAIPPVRPTRRTRSPATRRSLVRRLRLAATRRGAGRPDRSGRGKAPLPRGSGAFRGGAVLLVQRGAQALPVSFSRSACRASSEASEPSGAAEAGDEVLLLVDELLLGADDDEE